MMEQAPFYRTDLDGQKIPISFDELHPILRDIIHYFEVNLNEPLNVLVMHEYSKLEYWKYLSIEWFEPEFAQSKRYAWLCERGCLALLNGMSLDVLTEPLWEGHALWKVGKDVARLSLPYVRQYKPTEEGLEEGRKFVTDTLEFMNRMDSSDLDENGEVQFDYKEQAAWFTKNIVGDYFRSTAKLDFG